jgi:hypothetical protein
MAESRIIQYTASPTMEAFHNDASMYRFIMGPIGSGKSVACCFELFRLACLQRPWTDGVRRSRAIVVRNTGPELANTTMKTWKDWFPPGDPKKGFFGPMSGVPPFTHSILYALGDGTKVELEVIFLALDRPDDVKKLLSLETSFIWFNEARYALKEHIDGAGGRVGRYPGAKWGGCTRKAVIGDTNPPDDESWYYEMAVKEKPENWAFFYQPSGLSLDAENLENLVQPPDFEKMTLQERRAWGRKYYEDLLPGKEQEWINVYVHGQYGFVREGYPVFAKIWNSALHVAKTPFKLVPFREYVLGVDCSGRHPAACLLQRSLRGHWQVVWIISITSVEGMGSRAFSRLLKEELDRLLGPVGGLKSLRIYGDPAGAFADTNEQTYFQVLKANGINVVAARTNDIAKRLEVVEFYLSQLLDGEPLLQVSPDCAHLIRGFQGGYQRKRISTSGNTRIDDKPVKNRFSDIQDALQYALLGIGGLRETIGRDKNEQTVYSMDMQWAV